MWLLDVNLPTAVRELLRSFGIDCDTTVETFVEACEAEQVELLPEIRSLLDSAAG